MQASSVIFDSALAVFFLKKQNPNVLMHFSSAAKIRTFYLTTKKITTFLHIPTKNITIFT
jgi:hypothetical protein